MSPFEFVKSINYKKNDLLADDEDGQIEREYVSYIVNRSLSYTSDTVLHANECNRRPFLDKKLQYHYLLNSVRPKNRFGKWLKTDVEEKIEVIKQYYGYSNEKASQVAPIFSDNDIKSLKAHMSRGGLKE
jgi:hypothetical protein